MAERGIIEVPTAPVTGTNEQQTFTASGTLTSGQWRAVYRNDRTEPLNYNATATQIRDALRALNEIGASGVSGATGGPVSAPGTPVVVTFGGPLALANVPQMTVENISLVGGTINVTTNVAGVNTALRGVGRGRMCVALDTGEHYINVGTAAAPSWKLVTHAA